MFGCKMTLMSHNTRNTLQSLAILDFKASLNCASMPISTKIIKLDASTEANAYFEIEQGLM